MWTRQELKFRAKQAFGRNYGCAVGVALIMMIVTGALGQGGTGYRSYTNYTEHGSAYMTGHASYIGGMMAWLLSMITLSVALCFILFQIFAGNVLAVGGRRFFVLNQTGHPGMGVMLDGFRSGHYGNVVLTMFLRDLYTFLWTLLFVIPGIVKYYEYLMVPYVLAENPGMNKEEAFLISKQMMNGQKMDVFILDLSFIGWKFLSGITCGLLGIFYVNPYVEATFAELYTANRAKAYQEGYIR